MKKKKENKWISNIFEINQRFPFTLNVKYGYWIKIIKFKVNHCHRHRNDCTLNKSTISNWKIIYSTLFSLAHTQRQTIKVASILLSHKMKKSEIKRWNPQIQLIKFVGTRQNILHGDGEKNTHNPLDCFCYCLREWSLGDKLPMEWSQVKYTFFSISICLLPIAIYMIIIYIKRLTLIHIHRVPLYQ